MHTIIIINNKTGYRNKIGYKIITITIITTIITNKTSNPNWDQASNFTIY